MGFISIHVFKLDLTLVLHKSKEKGTELESQECTIMLPGSVGSLHLEALIKQLVGVFMANEMHNTQSYNPSLTSGITARLLSLVFQHH